MLRRRPNRRDERRGIILLVVLTMLTLFAVVGLSFVFYADTEAFSSRTFREAENLTRPDVNTEQALSFFLAQLMFPPGDTDGLFSAMRGHDLSTLMYGWNDDSFSPTNSNSIPWNGYGRLHEPFVFQTLDAQGNAVQVQIDGYD